MRPKVYIAGPITLGDWVHNFAQAASVQVKLMNEGFAPLNPMLTIMLPGHQLIPQELWIDTCIPWVEACDAVLRLPGKSEGADHEVLAAEDAMVPVFYSTEDLLAWRHWEDDDAQ